MKCTSIIEYKECITPKNWYFSNISHPFSIFYFHLDGEAFYTIDSKERAFEKGHLYILPANKCYSLRENSRNKFYALYIHAFTSPQISELIDVDAANDEFILSVLSLMRKYASEKNPIYMRNLTTTLISYIFERKNDSLLPLHLKLKNYVDDNFVEVFKRNTLSAQFNYSPSHLTRIFREEYNLTPKQYAEQLLLREIVILLRDGLKVAQIAERLDFSSAENLSRFFKKCYGESPVKYRKNLKNLLI